MQAMKPQEGWAIMKKNNNTTNTTATMTIKQIREALQAAGKKAPAKAKKADLLALLNEITPAEIEAVPQAEQAGGLAPDPDPIDDGSAAPIGKLISDEKWAEIEKAAQAARDAEQAAQKAADKKRKKAAGATGKKAAKKAAQAAGVKAAEIIINPSADLAKLDADRYASEIRGIINRGISINCRFVIDPADVKAVKSALVGIAIDNKTAGAKKAAEQAIATFKAGEIEKAAGKITADKLEALRAAAAKAEKKAAEYAYFGAECGAFMKKARKDHDNVINRAGGSLFSLLLQYVEGAYNFSTTAAAVFTAAIDTSHYNNVCGTDRKTRAAREAARSALLAEIEKYFTGLTYRAPQDAPVFRNFSWNMKAAEKAFIADYLTHRAIGARKGLFGLREINRGATTKALVQFAIMRLQGVKVVANTVEGLKEFDF